MNGETNFTVSYFFILQPGTTLKEGESIDHKVSNQNWIIEDPILRSATHSQQGQKKAVQQLSPYKGVYKQWRVKEWIP
jgi:hypothetical protein